MSDNVIPHNTAAGRSLRLILHLSWEILWTNTIHTWQIHKAQRYQKEAQGSCGNPPVSPVLVVAFAYLLAQWSGQLDQTKWNFLLTRTSLNYSRHIYFL